MASTKDWFESVAEAQRRAKRRLPPSVYGALIAGAERGTTFTDNERAFGELGFLPTIATGLGGERVLGTTVMGEDVSMPVMISPTGVQAVHPDAEPGLARAAKEAGVAMGLSSFASTGVEEVAAANPLTYLQLYWLGRERLEPMVQRARDAGVKGLILTLDWTFTHRRDWGSPAIPEAIDLRTALRMAPEVLRRPRWLASWLRAGGLPDITTPNMAPPGGDAPAFFEAYGEWMFAGQPSWEDIAWLREQWGGPFLVKGVTRPEDARRALNAGADALSVSNHGGNNLDGTPATIRNLPAVAEAVGDEMEVLLDGGIRRGSDVVKALALGARAVLIGRAGLWGLAANGQAGASNVLEILRAGVAETLMGIGRTSVHELSPDDVVVPPGFLRERAGQRA